MWRFLLTIVFFGKKNKNTHKTFHILKMKTQWEKDPHFENGSSFQNPFWKWKHVFRVIYKLGCHNVIRTGFSNQMITIWTTMLSIFGRVIIARNTYTTEHPELEINKCYLNYCLKVRKKAMKYIFKFFA